MAKTSKTMLNSSGESGYPCLVPEFRVNAFNFSPLRIMFVVGLSYGLVHGDDPEGCCGEGGGRGVHVWDRMYTHGGFTSMYGKTNTVL